VRRTEAMNLISFCKSLRNLFAHIKFTHFKLIHGTRMSTHQLVSLMAGLSRQYARNGISAGRVEQIIIIWESRSCDGNQFTSHHMNNPSSSKLLNLS